MFSRTLVCALSLVGLLGCVDSATQDQPINEVVLSDAVAFLNSDTYTYSVSAADVPQGVIDYLRRQYRDTFMIGDQSDYGKTTFSDVHMVEIEKSAFMYRRMMHFVLLNDTACLIAYTQGGVGVHSVVEYFRLADPMTHTRYVTLQTIDDTNKLREYLAQPKSERVVESLHQNY